jgi:hypothetical protein
MCTHFHQIEGSTQKGSAKRQSLKNGHKKSSIPYISKGMEQICPVQFLVQVEA